MMRFLDNKRNRIIIAVVVLLISITITSIISFSNETLPEYEIVETEVSKMYDKLSNENNDNTIFEKYYVSDAYIKRIKRDTSIVDFKKEVKDNTIKFLKDGKEVEEGLIGTGMVLVRNETEYKVYVSGDLNGNGTLDIQDISMVVETSKNVANTEDERIKADINEDGFVTKDDVTLLSRAFIGEEYELKEVKTTSVPEVKVTDGTQGDVSWYLDNVIVSVGAAEKYRIRGTNPVSLTSEKKIIKLDGFNAYKVEAFSYTVDGNISGISSVVVKVDDREIEPIVEFSSTEISSDPVVATIKFNKENVFVSNNDRSYEYTFYVEGEFTFEYFDITGRKGTKEVTVDWINDSIGEDGLWRYTRINEDEIYLRQMVDEEKAASSFWEFDSNGDSIVGYKDFYIPSEYDGYKVVGVGNNVDGQNILGIHYDDINEALFYINQVLLPDSLNEIGDYAFAGFGYFEELVIPGNVKNLGMGAFYYNYIDDFLIIEDGVNEIGLATFGGVNAVGDLIIPDSVEIIGDYAFMQTNIPGTLELSENIFEIKEGTFAYSTFTGDINIPNKVEVIGDYAFFNTMFNGNLKFGSNVEYIGQYSFANDDFDLYSRLVGELKLPNSVISIGDCAFAMNNFSGDLIIPDSVVTIGNGGFGFNGFDGDLVISDSVTSFGEHAFSFNVFGGNLKISKNISIIPDAAFVSTTFIGDIVLPSSIERIGGYAFSGVKCSGRLVLNDGLKIIEGSAFEEASFEGDFIIPDSVVEISNTAFLLSCFRGGNFVIGDGITDLSMLSLNGVFFGFDGNLIIGDGITTIPDGYFSNSNFTGSLKLGKNLKVIGNNAFKNSKFTGDLVLPDSVETIGDWAFASNSFDGTLILGNSLESIGASAFYNSSFKGDLIIPDSVTSVSDEAFYNSGFDGALTLSDNLSYIGGSSFSDNKFKGDLVIPDSVSIIDNNAFNDAGFDGTLTLGDNIMYIGGSSFSNNTFKGDLVIPDSVETIMSYAFYNSGFNGTLVLNNNVGLFDSYVFANNNFTGDLILPACTYAITESAFANNPNLSGTVRIGDYDYVSENAFIGTKVQII